MSNNKQDTRQSENAAALPAIGSAAGATLDVILSDLNSLLAAATSSPTPSVLMKRDANANTRANSFIPGYATNPTAASTTTLTVSSAFIQIFTGTTTQTVVLPVASTLVLGQQFYISNESTGNITVNASASDGSGLIVTMATQTHALVTVTNVGVGTGTWDLNFTSNASLNNPMTTLGDTIYGGTPVAGIAPPTRLGIGSAGQFLSVVSGIPAWGGGPMTTAGDMIYEDSTPTPVRLPIGTTGQILKVVSGFPTWVSPQTPQVSVLTSGTSYSVPAGALYLKIRMVGGGGGGGGSSNAAAGNGAGGGAGGYLEAFILGPLSASYSYNVGGGGNGGNNSNGGQAGFSGGNTTFDGSTFTANGGFGGGSSLGTNNTPAPIGLGGSSSGGYLNVIGGDGTSGAQATASNTAVAIGGAGGASYFGGGGSGGVDTLLTPTPGRAYGAGGGGGGQKTTPEQAGASGAAGIIIVEVYY